MSNAPLSFFHPASLIALWFGSGKSPVAPGTAGSLATVPFFYLFLVMAPGVINAIIISLVLLGIGTWASNVYMQQSGTHDPKEIVIDEVMGQFMVLSFAFYHNCQFECTPATGALLCVVGFLLFRLFDIIKPWPIKWCDQHIKGGFGVMFDDMLAALLAIVCLYAMSSLVSFNLA